MTAQKKAGSPRSVYCSSGKSISSIQTIDNHKRKGANEEMNNINLTKPIPNGGFCAIFRRIGCIGDSLSSGEFESQINGIKGYHDYYEYSWGQYIARACGSTVYNFSRGGLTAKEFLEKMHEDQLNIFDAGRKCQAYIIALGYNDMSAVLRGELEFGSVNDIDQENPENNASTFAGYMGRILSYIKRIEAKSRIFLVTMPVDPNDDRNELHNRHGEFFRDLARIYQFAYVIDLRKYAPVYDESFKKIYYLGGHMNAMGYLMTANMIMRYIHHIVLEKPGEFSQTGFIGRENDLHNENALW